MSKVAKAATGILAGVGVAAAIKSTAQIGMAYQDTLNNLKAVSGATAAQMAKVSATAKQLGADTSLTATSAADAATAMTELSKGGLSVDAAMKAAKGTLQLAAAAGIDAAQAATIQSSALNAYSLDASQAGRVSDVLANAANAAAGEITDFSQGMAQASAVAAASHISLEDTAATLGILANNGIKGADAGTLLKSALLAMRNTSKPAQAAMKDLNLQVYDAKGNFVGLHSIFGQLQKAQKGMSQETYEAATNTLFGSDASRLAGIAAKEGAKGFDAMRAAMGRTGSAADVAAAKAKGVHGAIEAFKSQIETIQINVFEALAPAVEGTVRRISGTMDTLGAKIPDVLTGIKDFITGGDFTGTWVKLGIPVSVVQDFEGFRDQAVAIFGNLKTILQNIAPTIGTVIGGAVKLAYDAFKLLLPVVQDVTGFFADNTWAIWAFAGAIGAVTAVVKAHEAAMAVSAAGGLAQWIKQTRIVTSITKIWTALQWAFNAAMAVNPLVLVGIALAALVAGLVLAYQHSKTFRDIVQGALHAVADAASWMWNTVLKPVFGFIVGAWTALADGIQWAWENILKPVFKVLGTVAQALGIFLLVVVFGPIMLAWKVLTLAIKAYWDTVLHPVFQGIAFVANWLWTSVLKPTWAQIQAGWAILMQGISWVWNNVLKPAWDAIATAAKWLWDGILKVVFGFIKLEWQGLLFAMKWAWENILKPVWNAISTAAKWLWNNVLKPVFGAIGTAWHGLASGFQWVFDHLIHPVFNAFTTVVDKVKSGFGTAVDWIARTWTTLKDKLMGPVQWVIDFVWNNGLRKLWNTINNLWGGADLGPFIMGSTKSAGPGGGGGGRPPARAFASGGIMPGYTPGRDVHRFVSPTGGILDLSGGEAVMRPEFTKAIGTERVNALNAAARSGGAAGVAQALGLGHQAHKKGGLISLPGWLDTALSFVPGMGAISSIVKSLNGGDTGGGLFGDGIWGTVKSMGSKIWDAISKLWNGDSGGSGGSAGGGTGRPGMGSDQIKNFIRSVDPLPYIWGGVGPGGYDCSGLAGEIFALMTGRPDHRRYFTTGSIGSGAQLGFKPGLGGMLNLGFNSHHVVGEYGGLGFEARSTAEGIKTGAAATNPSTMPKKMHLARGGVIGNSRLAGLVKQGFSIAGDPSAPFLGKDPRRVYDNGGVLPPGLTLTHNKSGKPEGILTNEQLGWLQAAASGGASSLVGGDLVLQVAPGSDVKDQMDEALFQLRRINRGGVHAGR